MPVINLLKETDEFLERNGIRWCDVNFVASRGKRFSPEQFKQYAKKIKYDNGYGLPEIVEDLMLVGKKFAIIRLQYDGAEWWHLVNLDPNCLQYVTEIEKGDLLAD